MCMARWVRTPMVDIGEVATPGAGTALAPNA